MRTPQLGPCPSHSQRNWAVLTRLRCEQTIVAQPRVTPAGGVPRRGSQVQKKKKKIHHLSPSKSALICCNLINLPRRHVTRKVNNPANDRMQQRICYLKGNGKGKSQGNFRYLVLSYLRLEGKSDFEGNRPGNHQNSLKSRPGNNKGIKYHRWL